MPLLKVGTWEGVGGKYLGQIIHKLELNSVLYLLGDSVVKFPLTLMCAMGTAHHTENWSATVPAEMLQNAGMNLVPVWAKPEKLPAAK